MNFDILKSKKFQAMIIGLALSVICHYLGLEVNEILAVDSPILAFILGQGIADHGKETELIKQRRK